MSARRKRATVPVRPEPDALALTAVAHVANLKATAGVRRMELIGMAEDGRMFLWDTGNVQPVSRFEQAEWDTTGRFIAGGHFVIEWRGHAIVVHCAPGGDGCVVIQFMCSRDGFRASREAVEPMLLGKVIPCPVAQAAILAGLERLTAEYTRKQQAPHRARGRAGR